MVLYRPVGLEELRLIYEADMRAFPSRLPGQPIFYPVTNEAYARQIASDWNTKSGSNAGFVTRLVVDDAYGGRFERHIVGGREHEELWVPAAELVELNGHIVGQVEAIAAYFGGAFDGYVPTAFGLKGKTAREQFVALATTLPFSAVDFACEVAANHLAVFLGFFFWEQADFTSNGIDSAARDKVLDAVRKRWVEGSRGFVPLGTASERASRER